MNIHKILLSVAFISLFFTSLLAQEGKIENTELQLDGDILIITYDVIGPTSLDNVWLDIKTTSNKTIEAKTLSGDIGKSISVGKRKRIVWNMKADGIDLQGEELNVKVLATKPSDSINTLTEIIEIERGKQHKNRDKIIYKNGNTINGKLNQRFTRNKLKFVSPDGNTLTINTNDIEKIKEKLTSLSADSIYLKNGDTLCGQITEIYPNDKIILESFYNSNKYIIQYADIKSVVSFFSTKYY